MWYDCNSILLLLCVQLSIFTALRPNAEGGHTLIYKEEEFDVNTKFERLVELLALRLRLGT